MIKKAVVFGGGLSGLGAERLLKKKGYEVFLIDDKTGIPSAKGIEILDEGNIEFIVKSPGIPWEISLLKRADEKEIKVISEIDLAYRYIDKDIKIISFTGTNGKTTTATKMQELLTYAEYEGRLAGNAGMSFAGIVADDIKTDYIVLELSSYQLENNPEVHSDIAGIINLSPDHLSRYSSVEEYYTTKFNIFERQTEEDFALINLDDKKIMEIFEEVEEKIKSQKIYLSREARGTIFIQDGNIRIMKNLRDRIDFHKVENIDEVSEKLIGVGELSLKGDHNLENMLFIIGTAKILGVPNKKIIEFLSKTAPLEHRMEQFFVKERTTFVNDSKGTNVESTLKALGAFEGEIILICGGDDKKLSNRELVEKIKEKVNFVYLIGENALLLMEDMEKIGYERYSNMETIENILNYFKENMDFSREKTVLFSPATSSFCQFRNFEERGRIFKELTVKILDK